MSVLSREREIGVDTLLQFIPKDEESTQLATIPQQGGGNHSYENERELLYKILYELRGNVSDLKREMNSLRKQLDDARQLSGAQGFSHPQPIRDVSGINGVSSIRDISDIQDLAHAKPDPQVIEAEEIKEPEEEEDTSLNLNDLSRQMIERALERNNGNRKKAAEELGISDRTLYRKIKKYGL